MQPLPIDINTLKFELHLTRGNSWPIWEINQPWKIESELVEGDTKKIALCVFINSNELIIRNKGKGHQETILDNGKIIRTQSLSINKIWANDILLEKFFIESVATFSPIYNQNDIKFAQQNNTVLLKQLNTLDFYYNGTWNFKFESPFFLWYNKLISNGIKKFNHWVQQSHLGIANENYVKELKMLLNKLS
jgi:hypothetical protein